KVKSIIAVALATGGGLIWFFGFAKYRAGTPLSAVFGSYETSANGADILEQVQSQLHGPEIDRASKAHVLVVFASANSSCQFLLDERHHRIQRAHHNGVN